MASSGEGSKTYTGWKRRWNAGSRSICFWYSRRVVAPIMCKSPRAKAGLTMLLASMAPSAPPAPIMVCISSTNKSTLPSERSISFIMALRRSSNSPRYLVPAISAPKSSDTTSLSRKESGTSPEAMRDAKPSAIAVLPTPASPMSIGLFLVRRLKICITRFISSSRPMTGSSLFCAAIWVSERVYFCRALNFLGLSAVACLVERSSISARVIASRVMRKRLSNSRAVPGTSKSAIKICSVETNSSWSSVATLALRSKACTNSGVRYSW